MNTKKNFLKYFFLYFGGTDFQKIYLNRKEYFKN